MGAWDETNESYLGIECAFHPLCPYCFKELKLYVTKIIKFSLDRERSKDGHAVDVEMVCTRCRYWQVQGVPISEEHYKTLADKVANDPYNVVVKKNKEGEAVGESKP